MVSFDLEGGADGQDALGETGYDADPGFDHWIRECLLLAVADSQLFYNISDTTGGLVSLTSSIPLTAVPSRRHHLPFSAM